MPDVNPVGTIGHQALAESTETCGIDAELDTLIEDLCLQVAGVAVAMSLA